MVIQHNLSAMYANTHFKKTSRVKEKNMEKLSSGYKVNRAADDAASLSISEKMRWQIRGLDKAVKNAEDGKSLIQVADGALNEMHSVLQRANELATQAANDTNTEADRDAIQREIDSLVKEVNRISKDTTFNTMPILSTPALVNIDTDDYSRATLDDLVTIAGTTYSRSKAMDFSAITGSNLEQLAGKTFQVHCSQGCSQKFVFSFTDSEASGATLGGSASRPNINVVVNINDVSDGVEVAQKIYDLAATCDSTIASASPGDTKSRPAGSTYIGHDNAMIVENGVLTFFALDSSNHGYIEAEELDASDVNLNLQVGALEKQSVEIQLRTINSTTLGINGLDVSDFDKAGDAMTRIQNAINEVSEFRSYLGAIQNRLEHTIDNLKNTSENTQSAESLIRDTDMAEEIAEYSKNNILTQAGQAMIAQANQTAQGVLNLLG